MDAPTPVAPWPRRLRRIAEPIAVAHFAAYPIALIWAVAAIPPTIHLFIHAIDQLGDGAAVGLFVVHKLGWPAAAAFALAHTSAIPWIASPEPRVGLRRCLMMLGGLAGLGVVGGVVSWSWLHLR